MNILNLLRRFGIEINEFLTGWCAGSLFVVRGETTPDAAVGFGSFVCDAGV